MSEREWKPGDVAMVTPNNGSRERLAWFGETHGVSGDRWWFTDTGTWTSSTNARPLVVIDPEDREQVERLRSALDAVVPTFVAETAVRVSLRSLIEPPKPYRDHAGPMPPWPDVSECHSSHVPDHECPQCAWEHEHDWVAWNRNGNVFEVPVRCSKCGGRKCDRPDCDQRRHTHTHHDEVTS